MKFLKLVSCTTTRKDMNSTFEGFKTSVGSTQDHRPYFADTTDGDIRVARKRAETRFAATILDSMFG